MIYIFGIFSALVFLFVVIELLRRGSLRERHAVLWLLAAIFALVISIFPQILESFAELIGVEVPLNLLLFGAIFILFFVNIQHSVEIARLEEKNRVLAEQISLAELGK